MTVSTTNNRISYTGNGSTTVFAFPYKFIATADIVVYVAGVLQSTGYTVGAPSDTGANITFTSAPASLVSVVILSDPSKLQSTSLPSTGPFPAKSVETMADKLTLLVQRLQDLINRTVRFPDSDDNSLTSQLPVASVRANKYLVFDASGNISTSGLNVQVQADAAAASAVASATSATASSSSAGAASSSASSASTYATSANLSSATATATSANVVATVASLAPTVTVLSGTGAQTMFTLPYAVTTKNLIDVFISGVYQQKSNFSVVGVTLTFTAAPPSGTNNIEIKTAANVTYTLPTSQDYGLITSSATAFADYGALN